MNISRAQRDAYFHKRQIFRNRINTEKDFKVIADGCVDIVNKLMLWEWLVDLERSAGSDEEQTLNAAIKTMLRQHSLVLKQQEAAGLDKATLDLFTRVYLKSQCNWWKYVLRDIADEFNPT